MRIEKQGGAVASHVVRLIIVSIAILHIFFATPAALVAQELENATNFLPLGNAQEGTTWRWTASPEVELAPQPNGGPLSVVDHLGQSHPFWDTLRTPRFIYHTYLSPAGWSVPAPVAETLGSATLLYRLLVDEQGKLHLV